MELCDLDTVRGLLGERGFRFSKALGQNFLVAPWVPERLAAASGAGSGDGVLEIGPGVGCLRGSSPRAPGRSWPSNWTGGSFPC